MNNKTLERKNSYRLERQKKKFLFYIKSFFIGLFCTTFVGLILYMLLFSPFFKVIGIDVSGNKSVSKEKIEKSESYLIGQRFFFVKFDENSFKSNFPIVKSVSIEKEFPNKIKLDITEYPPYAMVQTVDGTYIVSENGIVINKISNSSAMLSLPMVDSTISDKSKIPFSEIVDAVNIFENDKHSFITSFKYTYPYDLLITYSDSHTALISLNKSITSQLTTLQEISKSVGFKTCKNVDVRFESVYCSK